MKYPEMGSLFVTPDFTILITQTDLSKEEGKFKYFKTETEAKEYIETVVAKVKTSDDQT